MTELDAEDSKLVVLARGALGRTGGPAGAAIRDTDGRTYAAGDVALSTLRLTALQAAVAAAISSGAEGFEAAVVVCGRFSDYGASAVREVSPRAKIIFTDADGTVFDILDDGTALDEQSVSEATASAEAAADTGQVRGG